LSIQRQIVKVVSIQGNWRESFVRLRLLPLLLLLPQLRYQYSYENSIYFWDTVQGSDASGWRQEIRSLNLKVGAIHSLGNSIDPAYGVVARSTRRSAGLEEAPSSEICTKSFSWGVFVTVLVSKLWLLLCPNMLN